MSFPLPTPHPGLWAATAMIAAIVLASTAGEVLTVKDSGGATVGTYTTAANDQASAIAASLFRSYRRNRHYRLEHH